MDRYIGRKLDGRYKLTERIGEGGMAYVYKAEDLLTGNPVAVKILKDELQEKSDLVRRFRNESKAIGLLDHDNIVKVLDVNYSDQVQYIVMELLDGVTLKDYINANKPISWKNAVFITEQLLKALQHAHDRGIIHRDIKPQNVMLSSEGKVKVMDFGIARFSRSRIHTITDKALGTVHYISPEQAKGEECDARSDLYSVGAMMYEMCTGRLPFDGDSAVSIALMQISEEVKMPRSINPDIPEGLEEIIVRAMEKDPDKRYQSAGAMLLDLQEFRRNPSVSFLYRTAAGEAAKEAAREAEEAARKAEEAEKARAAEQAAAEAAAAAAAAEAAREAERKTTYRSAPEEERVTYRSEETPVKEREEMKKPEENTRDTRKADKAAAAKQKAAAKAKKAAEREKERKNRKRTINLPIAILMGLAAVVLIAAVILAVMTLQNSGSQIFVKHDDVDLPVFIGKTQEDVMKNPDYAMFNIKYVEEFNNEYEAGVIFDQTPVAPKIVKDNANITLYVSKGPRIVMVPDVIGKSYGEAMKLLQEQGLTVMLKPDANSEFASNVITRIEPDVGSAVESGSTVTMYINSPVTSVTTKVPDVKGMDFTTAKATLIMMGLQVGEITEEYNPDVEPGTVIGQSIEPDTEVVNATLVDLVLATNIGTFERTFSFRLPYKDRDGQTSFTASFVDAEGNTVFTKTLCTKDTGVSLTRTGTLDEEMLLQLNGRDYLKVLLNYQEGTFTVLEDYSAKNGFVTDRKTYSITVEYAEGGVVSYSASVLEGEDATIVITPNEGFVIDRVYDNDADVTGSVFNGTYVILGVNGNHTIRVTFKAEGT